jgi:hypothetical protein
VLLLYSEATIKVHNYTVVPVDFYECYLLYTEIFREFPSVFPVHVPEAPGAHPVSCIVGIHTRCFSWGYSSRDVTLNIYPLSVAYPGIFSGLGVGSNSVEAAGQRERVSRGGRPLVRGSAQFANQ